VAPVQLEIGMVGSPSAGTTPDASAPSAQPRKNGVSTEENANTAPITRASEIDAASPRSA
jgi:hypothetical protein